MMKDEDTITRDDALRALHALEDAGFSLSYEIRYVELTGVIPEFLTAISPYLWLVFHRGMIYKTSATSEASAINNVRFNLYGETPMSECAPFRAVNPARIVEEAIGDSQRKDKSASRVEFAQRLARMRRAV